MEGKTFTLPFSIRLISPLAILAVLFLFGQVALAQDSLIIRKLSLEEAIRMGLANSKVLKLSQAKVEEAADMVQVTGDSRLPSAKASFGYNEAILLDNQINLPGSSKPLSLHTFNSFYLGTLSVNEAIFAGNKLKYAMQSAKLAKKIASLNAVNDRQGVILGIIREYYTLFKVRESERIIDSSLVDIAGRLRETLEFARAGLATKNDVLRWELQQSNTMITYNELEGNRRIISYDMDLLLGLPTKLTIEVDSTLVLDQAPGSLDNFLKMADSTRADLAVFTYRSQIADVRIQRIKSNQLPTLGAGLQMYYINPNAAFIPAAGSLYLVPVTIGLNASWDIGSLWTTRHQVRAAELMRQESQIGRSQLMDHISSEVNQSYTDYLQSLEKINLLTTAVEQASENNRIMESKYRNQLATTTDRIDAETMLYQAEINLQLARVDAKLAYFSLLKSTGTIQ
ncbi:MAG TPA: TolC family protein [Chitinophagaceae bacterium]|nr:TolC family protein [Chitinophagaceae bacterium]